MNDTRIYRELGLGPSMASKRAQPTDQPGDFLEEDGSNLFLILNRMELDGSRKQVEEHFKRFYEPFQRASIQLHPRVAQLAIKERSLRRGPLKPPLRRHYPLSVPAGDPLPSQPAAAHLHRGAGDRPAPGHLRDVALLLLEASERTQLIVTTHSDILINALSGDPETVVVCERDPDMGTSFERLSAKKLTLWLEDSSSVKFGGQGKSEECGGNEKSASTIEGDDSLRPEALGSSLPLILRDSRGSAKYPFPLVNGGSTENTCADFMNALAQYEAT